MRKHTEKSIKRQTPKADQSRAERRRQDREKEKGEAVYNLTASQIEKIKNDAIDKAVWQSFQIMIGLPLYVLHTEFGFGGKRLRRFMNQFIRLWEQYGRGEIDLAKLAEFVKDETGVEI